MALERGIAAHARAWAKQSIWYCPLCYQEGVVHPRTDGQGAHAPDCIVPGLVKLYPVMEENVPRET